VESDLELDIENIEFHGFPRRPIAILKQTAQLPRIVLTTTVEDADGDGVPELPADGKSKATVRVLLRDAKQGLVKKSVELTFQASAGSLSERTVTTKEGKATIQFIPGNETVTAVIRATAEGFEPGHLQFELVPRKSQEK